MGKMRQKAELAVYLSLKPRKICISLQQELELRLTFIFPDISGNTGYSQPIRFLNFERNICREPPISQALVVDFFR